MAGATAEAAELSEWTKQDPRRMLHAVYRVGDLQKTIDYYKTNFGMKVRFLEHASLPVSLFPKLNSVTFGYFDTDRLFQIP